MYGSYNNVRMYATTFYVGLMQPNDIFKEESKCRVGCQS